MAKPLALITDVEHFVGLAAAKALAADGFEVVCEVAVGHCAAFSSANPDLDCVDHGAPDELMGRVVASWGAPDVVVSNDAFPAIRAPIDELKTEDLVSTLDALVTRPFLLARAAVPHMKAKKRGKLIFVTSAAPLRGLANYAPYVAARAAINSLAKSLALELGPHNIQVNAVAPNFLESETYFPAALMAKPEAAQKILKNIPLGRLGKQEEAGALVAYLASSKSDFVTGQTIALDGGWA